MKRPLYENMCGFCDQKSVESIGAIRVCPKHLDLVNAIADDAKKHAKSKGRKPTSKRQRAAA